MKQKKNCFQGASTPLLIEASASWRWTWNIYQCIIYEHIIGYHMHFNTFVSFESIDNLYSYVQRDSLIFVLFLIIRYTIEILNTYILLYKFKTLPMNKLNFLHFGFLFLGIWYLGFGIYGFGIRFISFRDFSIRYFAFGF